MGLLPSVLVEAADGLALKCGGAACAGRIRSCRQKRSQSHKKIRGEGVTSEQDAWWDVTVSLFIPGRSQGGERLLCLPGGGEEQEREFWHG